MDEFFLFECESSACDVTWEVLLGITEISQLNAQLFLRLQGLESESSNSFR